MKKATTKTTTTKDLKFDPKNANKHSKYGKGLLENSIRDNGFGRPILIANDNTIIAGNGTVEAANAVGMTNVRIIETNGNEIIAVKRTDIKDGSAMFHKMALADNVVAKENIVFDVEVVEAIVEEFPGAAVWGSIITDPPGQKNRTDNPDKAGLTSTTFQLSEMQSSKLKKALKISKELNAENIAKQQNKNENANALYFILLEYLKSHK